MITINLLPKKEIRQLRLVNLRSFIFKRVIALSIFGIIVILALGGLDFLLRRNLRVLDSELIIKMEEADSANLLALQEKIERFNQNLERISKLQENHTSLSPFLVELAQITPSEIGLTSLNVFREDSRGELTGRAQRRDDLLRFQERMEESDFFGNIESPLSNLTSRENVDFRLKFQIRK